MGSEVNVEHTAMFTVGDWAAGAVVGAATAMAVHAAVGPGMDMVLAMIAGMGIGMVVHLVLGLMLTPVLGMFHLMVPGSLIGMYGGMFFAMRDSMQAHSAPHSYALTTGALFGVIVTVGVQIYDRVLQQSGLEGIEE